MHKYKEPMRVLVCGLNWSGSGAVFDLLREYNKISLISGGLLDFAPEGGLRITGEFEQFRAPGLIGDFLEMNDYLFDTKQTVKNLKRQNLVFKIKSTRLIIKARKPKDLIDAYKVYKQVIKTNSSLVDLIINLQKSLSKEERLELAKSWLNSSIQTNESDKNQIMLFDQPIHLFQHINVWPDFFRPFKLIIVHRDPRDIFAEQVNYKFLFRQQMDSNAISLYGSSLDDAISYRIATTKSRMRAVDNVLSVINSNEVLLLKFEDLVLKYDETKHQIQNFIGLYDSDHSHPKKYFNPDKSNKNIGLQAKCEIKIPESRLSELLEWYNTH